MNTTMNTVCKVMYSGDLSKNEAKRLRIRTMDDVIRYVMDNDTSPGTSESMPVSEENTVDGLMKDKTEAYILSNHGIRYLHIVFTCLEYYKANDDGEFEVGSDYDRFAEFTEDQKNTIREFVGGYGNDSI